MTVTDSAQHSCSRQVTPIHVACPAITACTASANSTSGVAPLQLNFTATVDGGCGPYTWSWDFGDGGTSTVQNPTYTYQTPGDYTATMTVTDSAQHSCSRQVTPIHVACPALTCTASADSMSGVAPLLVNFTATVDGGCGPYTWSWDFGDGGTSTEQNPSYTYETGGEYTATMTVTDSEQHTCSQQVTPIEVISRR
jgi:PKD repeat protein